MPIPTHYSLHSVPEGLEGLTELALDLRWSWNHAADRLWQYIAPELWVRTANPWLILQNISVARLEELSADSTFRETLNGYVMTYREAMGKPTWFQQTYPESRLTVAYFSMEFGLSEALPIYSGGLGILAGDYLKTAGDLGVPAIGVGLLYQQGYFRQVLDITGSQEELYPYNNPSQLPIMPVRDESGEWLGVEVDFPGRRLRLRAWEARVGRTKLYLLDSNDPTNSPADRGITSELYGGGADLRLQQEIVLGIGGWRLLQAVDINVDICHLNEGHAALAVLERAREFMVKSRQHFDVAMAATRPGNIFTTHTPVEAGFDRFPPDLIRRYLGSYADRLGIGLEGLLPLGRQEPNNAQEPFNMAYLAISGSGSVNGVSQIHAEVSRRIFQPLFPRIPQREVPITSVTNGVHMPSWDSSAADEIWSDACGKERWLGDLKTIEDDLRKVPDEMLWNMRNQGRRQLIDYARNRLAWQLTIAGGPPDEINEAKQLLDPEVLTIGFARRFTGYKRPNLLLHDPDRLTRLLCCPQHPVQLILAGKAHPQDEEGKAMIRAWSDFIRRPEVRPRVVFLSDYDMSLAEQLVQGVDLWINTPRRPWEACGTSGMKILVSGGLNLSELDGWWAEAYRPEVGWAIGNGQEHGHDPGVDAREAEQLYALLEGEIASCFYDRNANGIPECWVARMRASMAELTPRFSSNRMVREYVERLYLPASRLYHSRIADGGGKAELFCRWRESLEKHWVELNLGQFSVREENGEYTFMVRLHLGEVHPDYVRVELYAEPNNSHEAETHAMERREVLTDTTQGYLYVARLPAHRPASDYTPRVIPFFNGAVLPLEAPYIRWLERTT
jgi:glycogen phosphorylase